MLVKPLSKVILILYLLVTSSGMYSGYTTPVAYTPLKGLY